MVSLSPSSLLSSVKAKVPFLNRKKSGSHMRAFARHPCCIMGELLIADKSYKLDGLIIELSRGGVRFREASSYVLDRSGVNVVVMVNGSEYPGVVVNVAANGYGIKLDSLMPEGDVEKLMGAGTPAPLVQH